MMVLIAIFLLITTLAFGEEFLIKVPPGKSPPGRIIKRIGKDLFLVKLDGNIHTSSTFTEESLLISKNETLRALALPNDTCTDQRWDLGFINAFSAWDISTGSGTIYIGLPDTGVDYNHPDLEPNLYRNDGDCDYDGYDNDGNGYVDDCYGVNVLCYPDGSTYDPGASGCNSPDALDDYGHGTHIAGVIGAVGNNSLLVPGILWNVKIIPCKFLDASGNGDISGELMCLRYFKDLALSKGISIVAVNASYGNFYPENTVQKQEIGSLADIGVLYISAAGNFSENNDLTDFHPCNYDLPNQICVGAVDRQGNLPSFSHYGFRKVKIMAPGVDILSLSTGDYSDNCGTSLLSLDGTSVSAPFVTAAAGLIKSIDPTLPYKEVRRRIITSAVQKDSLIGKAQTCGYLDLQRALNPDTDPRVCFSHPEISFGTVTVCGHYERTFIIKNVGNSPVSVLWLWTEGGPFYLENDSCSGRTLSSFEECSVKVIFDPPHEGTFFGYLRVSFLDQSLDRSILISGSLSGAGGQQVCHEPGGCGGEILMFFYSFGVVIVFSAVRRKFPLKVTKR
jgi:hypothetical protein